MNTLIIKKGDKFVFQSELKGLRPLVEFISKNNLNGCEVYDKVVGEAAARVYCFYHAKKVDCDLISEPAIKRLNVSKIEVSYKAKVEQILRLDKKGVCPGEIDSWGFENDEEFIIYLKKKFL